MLLVPARGSLRSVMLLLLLLLLILYLPRLSCWQQALGHYLQQAPPLAPQWSPLL